MRSCFGGILLTGAVFLLAGCATPLGDHPTPAEVVLASTYPIASGGIYGTGFLVAVKTKQSGIVPVVITSGHFMRKAGTASIFMPLRIADEKGNLSSGVFEVARGGEKAGPQVRHPRLDVAAFVPRFPDAIPKSSTVIALEERNFRDDPRAGESICFAGFPDGAGGPSGLFGLVRGGKVASIDQSVFDLRSFVIDGNVHPGDSGAPVFRDSQRGGPELLGMMIRRQVGSSPNHVGLAVDSRAITETIDILVRKLAIRRTIADKPTDR